MLHHYVNLQRPLVNINQILAPLLLRFYLVPIFWMAGISKFNSFEDTVAWFGNPEWGLGFSCNGNRIGGSSVARIGIV